jgi:aromatic ring-opening dioxygenase catalytic subunit (LigB family)
MSSVCKATMRLPVLFLSHGGGPCFFMNGNESPMFADIDKHSKAAEFYKNIPKLISNFSDVKSILVISAHWEASEFTVGYQSTGTSLVYDYYGNFILI